MLETLERCWTLESEPLIAHDLVPKYPSYELAKAHGGEITYELLSGKGKPKTVSRKAVKGELLRDVSLRYIMDYKENLRYRLEIKDNAQKNLQYQEMQKMFCRSNILYFINTFCWTYDPRKGKNKISPLLTFPFQDEMVTWCLWLIKMEETGLIEKSRDMGATWCAVAVIAAYQMLFFDNVVEYQLSLREDDVDNKQPNSLMGKLRLILEHVPDWMRGGWVKEARGMDQKMIVTIPQTKSQTLGQLTKSAAGRSGRASRASYDEFAHVDDSEAVLEANSSLANSELFLSTVRGSGNAFARMAHDPNVNKMTLHWSLHPLKNKEWALKERAKAKYTDESWAQEQEISYEKSTSGRVYPEFVSLTASIYDWQHIQTGEYYEYDPHYDVYVGLDFGMADPTSLVFAQIKPAPLHFEAFTKQCLVFFREEESANQVIDEWAKLIHNTGYRYENFVGDFRSGNQRDATGMTWLKYFSRHGIKINGKYNNEYAPIQEVKKRLLLQGGLAVNKKACPRLVQAFQNWKYQVDNKTNLPVHKAKPLHDKNSHCMKAVAYLVDYIYGSEVQKKTTNNQWDFRVFDEVEAAL